MLTISLRCLNDTRLAELSLGEDRARSIESLRFYINGEPQLVYPLYEMIFNNATAVELRAVAAKKRNGAAGANAFAGNAPAYEPEDRSALGPTKGCSLTRRARLQATGC